MPQPWSRRTALRATGVGLTAALTGCVMNFIPVGAGALVVDNEHDQSHTVTVHVSKTSDHSDAAPFNSEEPPTTTPLWQRARTVEVAARRKIRKSGFISEPGAFFVRVQLETGTTAATWLGLYSGGRNGDKVGGASINVDIYEDGRLHVDTPMND